MKLYSFVWCSCFLRREPLLSLQIWTARKSQKKLLFICIRCTVAPNKNQGSNIACELVTQMDHTKPHILIFIFYSVFYIIIDCEFFGMWALFRLLLGTRNSCSLLPILHFPISAPSLPLPYFLFSFSAFSDSAVRARRPMKSPPSDQ